MRFVALLLAVSPSFAFADTIEARIKPTDVIVYPQGATVQRVGTINLPAGRHDLVLPDLPRNLQRNQIEVLVEGATILATEWRNETPGPYQYPDTPEFKAAEAAFDAAKDALQAKQDQIAQAKLSKEAAQAQIAFLADLSNSKTLPDGVDTLRDLSRMISEETLTARRAMQDADVRARDLQKEVPDLQDTIEAAQLVYEAQITSSDNPAQMTLSVNVPSAISSTVTVKYLIDRAQWEPSYDMRLTTGDAPELLVERGAYIFQNTGETWQDVNLTLSTVLPYGQSDPGHVWSQLLRISDPKILQKQRAVSSYAAESASPAEPIIESPVIVEEMAAGVINMTGVEATYAFDHQISVDSDDRAPVNLALGDLTFDAEVSAQAVPLYDETAFRMVDFTNASDERLLPSRAVNLYVDDVLVAETNIAGLVPGDDTKIGFGPLHGLRLTRTILDRNEGDRGIFSASNEKTEDVRIDIENLTGEDWNVTLLDRVPYTEQEDLSITWSAAPRPTTEDYEDRRGILHWDLDMSAGKKQSIALNTKISWPDGMILR